MHLFAVALNYGKTESVKRIVLSGHTHSTDLHKFTKVQFQHRKGEFCTYLENVVLREELSTIYMLFIISFLRLHIWSSSQPAPSGDGG